MEFIPHWTTLGAYTIAAVVLALTPGPDMTFFLAQSVSNSAPEIIGDDPKIRHLLDLPL